MNVAHSGIMPTVCGSESAGPRNETDRRRAAAREQHRYTQPHGNSGKGVYYIDLLQLLSRGTRTDYGEPRCGSVRPSAQTIAADRQVALQLRLLSQEKIYEILNHQTETKKPFRGDGPRDEATRPQASH